MENEGGSWIDGDQNFQFTACAGSYMKDVKGQLEKAGKKSRPQMVIGSSGSNDAHFGDILRACIYKPANTK